MVTHSAQAASGIQVLFIKDGEVFHQIYRGEENKGGDVSDDFRYLNHFDDGR